MSVNPRRARLGFTLPEMLIVLAIFGITIGAIMTVVMRQQQFYRSANEVLTMRSQLRHGLGAIVADLRAISPAAGDFYALSDRAIELRSSIGSSIACRLPTTKSIVIPPSTLTSGTTLSAWMSLPVATDSFFVYDDSSSVTVAAWKGYKIETITAVSDTSGCTTASGFVQASDMTRSSYRITIPSTATLPPTLLTGAPIRFFRRARYELYRASDNKWYLGYFDCIAGRSPVCNSLRPMAGPFRDYSTETDKSGLLFSFFDVNGAALTAATSSAPNVARVTVSLRGQTLAAVSLSGGTRSVLTDSLVMDVAIRNRN